MIDLQDIITTKRELLSRATCSLSPINYSAGMAEDQKERYIQYLAEQNQDLRLTSDAMKLVLEDGSDEGSEGSGVLYGIETC